MCLTAGLLILTTSYFIGGPKAVARPRAVKLSHGISCTNPCDPVSLFGGSEVK